MTVQAIAAPPTSAYLIDVAESLDAVRDEWRQLAPRARNIFGTWEWAQTWHRYQPRGVRLLIGAVRSAVDGRTVAILPLRLWSKGPVDVVRFLGHGGSDQLGPICAPGDRRLAVDALWQLLDSNTQRWNLFLGERLHGGEGWSELLGGRVIHHEASPVIRFHGRTWDEYLRDRSRHFRRDLHRQEQRLSREFNVRFRLANDPERIHADVDEFFRLHGARWTEGRSSLLPRQAFLRDFALEAFARGWLRLWFLELDGHPAAVRYDLRFADVWVAYNSGRDRAFDEQSAGTVLRAHTMRQALDEGAAEYRFLRGGEEYKYRFTEDDPGLDTMAVPNGLSGRAIVASTVALAHHGRFRSAVRHLI
jgi:CelD/BcsL family acetyltransferase involved in cellulose biosynthesis